jgi:hypothetical protein
MFLKEPIGPLFSCNRISLISEEPNRSVSVNRTLRVSWGERVGAGREERRGLIQIIERGG